MKITNKLNLPQPFVDCVSKEYEYKDKRYSVTTVIKGVKEILLQRRHSNEIEQDVSDMIWLIWGTAMHKVLEEGKEAKDELKETKIQITMPNGYTLSGQQDLYSESLKRITDYKSGTVWKVIYGDWEDYRKQCLIYAYMFDQLGFDVDNADIVMVLKDWSQTKAKTEDNYPQYPVHIEHFNFDATDFANIEKELIEKFEEIERCEKLADDDIPVCSKEERWSTPTKYALMKRSRKTAIKLYDTKEDAESKANELGEGHYVEIRKGEDKKCENYCSCRQFCNYWRSTHEEGI